MPKFTLYHDPGHGWLEVPFKLIKDAGLEADISWYSYKNGSKIYLEEDCDAPLFVAALKDSGISVDIIEQYQDPTPIRDYAHYEAL